MFSSIRSLRLFERVLLVALGAAGSAYGYLLTVRAHLGDGPLFTVQDGLHQHLGISLGVASILAGLILVCVAKFFGAHLGVGTLAIPVLAGLYIDLLEPYATVSGGPVVRWAAFFGGTAVMMLGGVLALSASLGSSAMDGVMLGLARHSNRSPSTVRILMEVALAALGAAIGGHVGLGTVAMGLMVGPLFVLWNQLLGRVGLPLAPLSAARADDDVVSEACAPLASAIGR